MPNSVWLVSLTLPPESKERSSGYMLCGPTCAGHQRRGFATGTSKVKLADPAAAMVWAGVRTGASAVPLGSLTTPDRITLAAAGPLLTTIVVTWTVAALAVGVGVVTKVAY